MGTGKLQTDITTGRLSLPVTGVCCLLWWVITLQDGREWGSLAFLTLTGYVLAELNTAFTLIRIRTTFPVCLYGWLTAVLLFLHPFGWEQSIPLLVTLAVYQLFLSYESPTAPANVFHGMLFLSVGSLVFPPVVWFVPLFVGGAVAFRAGSLKSLCSGLLGLVTPYWLLGGYAFLQDKPEVVRRTLQAMTEFRPVDYTGIPQTELVCWGILTLLLWVFLGHYRQVSYRDRTRVRLQLSFLAATSLWTAAFIALQPQHLPTLLPVQLLGTVFLATHLFTLTRTRRTSLYFVVFLMILIALAVYNLWTKYFNF